MTCSVLKGRYITAKSYIGIDRNFSIGVIGIFFTFIPHTPRLCLGVAHCLGRAVRVSITQERRHCLFVVIFAAFLLSAPSVCASGYTWSDHATFAPTTNGGYSSLLSEWALAVSTSILPEATSANARRMSLSRALAIFGFSRSMVRDAS